MSTQPVNGMRLMTQVRRDPQVLAAEATYVRVQREHDRLTHALSGTRNERMLFQPHLTQKLMNVRAPVVALPMVVIPLVGSAYAAGLLLHMLPHTVTSAGGGLVSLGIFFGSIWAGTKLATPLMAKIARPVLHRWVDSALVKELKRQVPPSQQRVKEARTAFDASVHAASVRHVEQPQPVGPPPTVEMEEKTVTLGGVKVPRQK